MTGDLVQIVSDAASLAAGSLDEASLLFAARTAVRHEDLRLAEIVLSTTPETLPRVHALVWSSSLGLALARSRPSRLAAAVITPDALCELGLRILDDPSPPPRPDYAGRRADTALTVLVERVAALVRSGHALPLAPLLAELLAPRTALRVSAAKGERFVEVLASCAPDPEAWLASLASGLDPTLRSDVPLLSHLSASESRVVLSGLPWAPLAAGVGHARSRYAAAILQFALSELKGEREQEVLLTLGDEWHGTVGALVTSCRGVSSP